MPRTRKRSFSKVGGIARKRYFSGKRRSKRKYKGRKFAKRVSRVLTSLCEKKRTYFSGSLGGLTNTWVTEELTMVAQGDTSNQRIGNDISQHKLTIKGSLRLDTMAIDKMYYYVRFMLVRAKFEVPRTVGPPSVAQLDMSQILAHYDGSSTPQQPIWSFYNREKIDKYDVLYDKIIRFDVIVGASKPFIIRIPLKRYKQKFSGAESTTTTKGAIFLCVTVDTSENDVFPSLAENMYEWCFYYTDM